MKLELSRPAMPFAGRASLKLVARSHTLRCDVKQAEPRFVFLDDLLTKLPCFALGDVLPGAFVKGPQPKYLESLEPEGVPVISTLAIQGLSIDVAACRFIDQEQFDAIPPLRRPQRGDVLLTMDGGPSIGKPALFALEDDYAVDSHVAILRPIGLDARVLVYLLASPLGQVQFQRAESGASGQTSVTEDDVRRFRFPLLGAEELQAAVESLDAELANIKREEAEVARRREAAWAGFTEAVGPRRITAPS